MKMGMKEKTDSCLECVHYSYGKILSNFSDKQDRRELISGTFVLQGFLQTERALESDVNLHEEAAGTDGPWRWLIG